MQPRKLEDTKKKRWDELDGLDGLEAGVSELSG
jgi:hypothetical protein